jgi:hypothetical protein
MPSGPGCSVWQAAGAGFSSVGGMFACFAGAGAAMMARAASEPSKVQAVRIRYSPCRRRKFQDANLAANVDEFWRRIVLKRSLRAERSNPSSREQESWIASLRSQ